MSKRMKTMPKNPLKIVCCLVIDDQNRLLLLRRHAEDLGGGLWATPGGRQELNEEPETTVLREVKEETDLDLVGVSYLGEHELRMPHGTAHMKSYLARLDGPQKVVIDVEEHDAYRWFEISNITSYKNIIWGLPTTLMDFDLIEKFKSDPTLKDGSQAILL